MTSVHLIANKWQVVKMPRLPRTAAQVPNLNSAASEDEVLAAISSVNSNLVAISILVATNELHKYKSHVLLKYVTGWKASVSFMVQALKTALADFDRFIADQPLAATAEQRDQLLALVTSLEKLLALSAAKMKKDWKKAVEALPVTWGHAFSQVFQKTPGNGSDGSSGSNHSQVNANMSGDNQGSQGPTLTSPQNAAGGGGSGTSPLVVGQNDPQDASRARSGGGGSSSDAGGTPAAAGVDTAVDLSFDWKIFDKHFRQQLQRASAGVSLVFGSKGDTGYIDAYIISPDEMDRKFDGTCDLGRMSFTEMFEALTPLHEAPNVPYQRKINAVIRVCDGLAKNKALIYQNKKSRHDYLTLWRDMYLAYGSVQSRINLYSMGIETTQPKDTSIAAVSSCAGHLVSLVTCLNDHDHPENHNANWRKAWLQLFQHDPARFETYATQELTGWNEIYNLCERTYIRENPGEKLIKYKDYLYRKETAERNRANKFSVMRTSVQTEKNLSASSSSEPTTAKRPRDAKDNQTNTCIVDGRPHSLKECPVATIDERKEFFKEADRCFKCGCVGHKTPECFSKRLCSRCFVAGIRGDTASHHVALCPIFEKARLRNASSGTSDSGPENKKSKPNNNGNNGSGAGGQNNRPKGKWNKGNGKKKPFTKGSNNGGRNKAEESSILSQIAELLKRQQPINPSVPVSAPTPFSDEQTK